MTNQPTTPLSAEDVYHEVKRNIVTSYAISVIEAYAAQEVEAKTAKLQARIAELEKDGTYKDTCEFLNGLLRQKVAENERLKQQCGQANMFENEITEIISLYENHLAWKYGYTDKQLSEMKECCRQKVNGPLPQPPQEES